jgi:hypothetical protein
MPINEAALSALAARLARQPLPHQRPGPGERVPEWEYTPDYANRYPLSSNAEMASRGGATGRQASRNVQPPVPDPTRKAQADMFQSIDRGQGEEFIEQRKMEQLLRQLQEEEAMDRATEARLRLFRR